MSDHHAAALALLAHLQAQGEIQDANEPSAIVETDLQTGRDHILVGFPTALDAQIHLDTVLLPQYRATDLDPDTTMIFHIAPVSTAADLPLCGCGAHHHVCPGADQ